MNHDATVSLDVGEDGMEKEDYGFFKNRLYSHMDRHSANAVSFEKILEMQYAESQGFRDANAARIVMEAGSGRTRAETNNPTPTSAAGNSQPNA